MCREGCFNKCTYCDWQTRDDWQRCLPEPVIEAIGRDHHRDRDEVWVGMAEVAEDSGWRYVAEACVRGFSDLYWEGGFGGSSWASIARLARAYLRGEIRAEIFMNMAWSQQHNNGIMFNKLWSYDACDRLKRLLEEQATDDYRLLCVEATPLTAQMWNSRRWITTDYEEHDPTWFGAQPTEEVVW